LIFVHLRGGIQDALGGVEHVQLHIRSYLEGLPGDWNVFFIKPENPTSGDHQIGDLVCLRTYHDVFDAARPARINILRILELTVEKTPLCQFAFSPRHSRYFDAAVAASGARSYRRKCVAG
jgi:hypothetical protein